MTLKIRNTDGEYPRTSYIHIEDGYEFNTIQEYIAHVKGHSKPHVPALPFYIWLGRMTNQFVWDLVGQFTTEEINTWHVVYLEATKDTCRNSPCWDCIQRNRIRTMPEKKYMAYKLEKDGKYILNKSGTVKREYKPRLNYTPNSLNTGEQT